VQFWLDTNPIIAAAWTLRYEVGFYALVTVLIIASRNAVSMHTVRIGVYGFLVVWLFASATHLQPLQFLTLDQYGPLFMLGVLLGISRDLVSLRTNGPAILVAVALTFQTLLDGTDGNHWTVGSRLVVAFFVMVLAIGAILWSSLRAPREVRIPWVHRWVATLSLMTYPIYLLHNEFGFGVIGALLARGVPVVVTYAIGGVAVLLLSFLSVQFFEPWARARLRRLFGWATSTRRTG
jgi:peptidoglycan/LPS O-acetylase OafA/YrhL